MCGCGAEQPAVHGKECWKEAEGGVPMETPSEARSPALAIKGMMSTP
jgi:hypothetical protein